jgi:hypothetical protein
MQRSRCRDAVPEVRVQMKNRYRGDADEQVKVEVQR